MDVLNGCRRSRLDCVLDMRLWKRSFGGGNNRNSDMGAEVYQASTLRRFSKSGHPAAGSEVIRRLVDGNGAKPQMEWYTTAELTSHTARPDIMSRIWELGMVSLFL